MMDAHRGVDMKKLLTWVLNIHWKLNVVYVSSEAKGLFIYKYNFN